MEENSYVTFHVTARDGRDIEMAVVDEFVCDRKQYVVGAVVENDVIRDDGQYIYRCEVSEDDFRVFEITSEVELRKVSEAYLAMDP